MSEPVNETGLVRNIVRAIHTEYPGCWGFKVHGSQYQAAGIPDLIFCVEGLLVGLEAKHQKPGESKAHARARATPIQRRQIRAINEAGGIAGVVLSPEEALDLIRRAFVKQETRRREAVHAVR